MRSMVLAALVAVSTATVTAVSSAQPLLVYPAATHFTVLQQSDSDTASFLSRVLATH